MEGTSINTSHYLSTGCGFYCKIGFVDTRSCSTVFFRGMAYQASLTKDEIGAVEHSHASDTSKKTDSTDHEAKTGFRTNLSKSVNPIQPISPRSTASRSRSRSRDTDHQRERSRDRRERHDRKRTSRERHHRHKENQRSRSRSRTHHTRNRSVSRSSSREDEREDHSPSHEERRRGRKRSRTREEIEVRPPEEQVPKKKKEYKATSSFIGDDEFEDILERGWFYVDSNDDKQGPFTTKEMKEWYVAGFFNNELLVKRVADPNFQKISDREEFKQLERKPSAQTYASTTTFEQQQTLEQETAQNPYYQDFPAVYDPSFEQEASAQDIPNDADPSNYVQAAFFTTLKGRFSAGDQATHWKKKGLPTDKDGRMLSHYFDVEAYQEQMRNCDPPKKKKVTKNMIKYYKKRKEDRKRRRALML